MLFVLVLILICLKTQKKKVLKKIEIIEDEIIFDKELFKKVKEEYEKQFQDDTKEVVRFIRNETDYWFGNIMDEYIKNQNVFENKFESSLKEVEDKWFIYNEEIEKKIRNDR